MIRFAESMISRRSRSPMWSGRLFRDGRAKPQESVGRCLGAGVGLLFIWLVGDLGWKQQSGVIDREMDGPVGRIGQIAQGKQPAKRPVIRIFMPVWERVKR